jgi:hypothetical protein
VHLLHKLASPHSGILHTKTCFTQWLVPPPPHTHAPTTTTTSPPPHCSYGNNDHLPGGPRLGRPQLEAVQRLLQALVEVA